MPEVGHAAAALELFHMSCPIGSIPFTSASELETRFRSLLIEANKIQQVFRFLSTNEERYQSEDKKFGQMSKRNTVWALSTITWSWSTIKTSSPSAV
ncbi:hypothetical protein KQX54_017184 [Cotesia glomerata]|uniref:Uncharacterized protein n=1 Tax=Cotesia glomerata TaxID=32391 RepID=A0AAV7II21_COTGL|nr:hypothetical protein KQX54_017184 [Cotesia glomerata]